MQKKGGACEENQLVLSQSQTLEHINISSGTGSNLFFYCVLITSEWKGKVWTVLETKKAERAHWSDVGVFLFLLPHRH